MRKIKLTLEFDGSAFYGWQVQARTCERTVQGVLEAALQSVPGAAPRVMAAGRTDAGVHALAMVAHYLTNDKIPTSRLPQALNSRLPADVRVLAAEEVPASFEAQFGCCYRRYLYRMRLSRDSFAGMALDHKRVLFLPQRLDVAAMQQACAAFLGTHDFAALATQETRKTSRTLYWCRLEQTANDLSLHVAADGFLRNMVRAIVGTLLWVGEGKIAASDLPALLASRDRGRLGPNAPAHALYFAEAGYAPWDEVYPAGFV